MGNSLALFEQCCNQKEEDDLTILMLHGHIKDSRTRAVKAILDKAKIVYKFVPTDK